MSTDTTVTTLDSWHALRARTLRIEAEVDSKLAAYGMACTTMALLVDLANFPDRMQRIAARLGMSPSGLTRAMDTLERAGLAKRTPCEDDRRGMNASITPAGVELLEILRPTYVAAVEAAMYGEDR